MKTRVKISKEDLAQIEKAVKEAEKKTSGEIVPQIVSASHDYWWIHWLWAAIGMLMASLAVLGIDLPWTLGLGEVFSLQFVGASLGALVAYSSTIKRFTATKKRMAFHVHRQCLANFVDLGLIETRDRTGILIYLSLLEHRVEILADKGIHSKTPKGYWSEQVKEIVEGIHCGKAVESLCKVIHTLGDKLAQDFPPREDDTNEISNQLRIGHNQPTDNDPT